MLSRLLGMLRIEIHASTARLETGLATAREKLEHARKDFQRTGKDMQALGKAQAVFASLAGNLGQLGGTAGRVTGALGGLARSIHPLHIALAAAATAFSVYIERARNASRANAEFLESARKNREELKAAQDDLNEAMGGPLADLEQRRRSIANLEAEMDKFQRTMDEAARNPLSRVFDKVYVDGEATTLTNLQNRIDMTRDRIRTEREELRIAQELLRVRHLQQRAERERQGDAALAEDTKAIAENQRQQVMSASEMLDKLRTRLTLEESVAALQGRTAKAGDAILSTYIRQRAELREAVRAISQAETSIGDPHRNTPFADEAAVLVTNFEKAARARAMLERESALVARLATSEEPLVRAKAIAKGIDESLQEALRQVEAQRRLVQEMQYLGEVSAETAAKEMRNLEKLPEALERSAAIQARRTELQAQVEGGTFTEGYTAQIQLMQEEFATFGKLGAQVAKQMTEGFAGGVTDALFEMVDGTKSAREAFADFARSFILQTARMIVQALILYAVLTALGLSTTMQTQTFPSMPSVTDGGKKQHGGAFRVGGAGGIDSQMVMFRATPGETVAVSRPGDSGGGTHVEIINMTGSPAQAQETTGPDGKRRIRVLIGEAVADDLAQGGPASRALTRHFGIPRRPSRGS